MSVLLILTGTHNVAVGQATETEAAQTIRATHPRSVGQATETDSAGRVIKGIGRASETEAARPIRVGTVHLAQHVGEHIDQGDNPQNIVIPVTKVCRVGDVLAIRVVAAPTSGSVTTATDSGGNTYSEVCRTALSSSRYFWLLMSKITTDLNPGDTITITLPDTATRQTATVDQFTGIRAADGTGGTATGSGTTPSASKTPASVGELFIGSVSVTNGPTGDTFTEDSDTLGGSWKTLTRVGGAAGVPSDGIETTINSAYKVATVSSQQTYNPTLGTSRGWLETLGAFLPEMRFVAVNQATETDTAQTVKPQRRESIGQASETDVAQAVAHTKRVALGQSTESDTSQAISPQRREAIGQASDAEIAQPISHTKLAALGLCTETDTCQPISPQRRVPVGLASETDTAQATSAQRAVAVGLASETDTANAITTSTPIAVAVGRATETDTAQDVASIKYAALGRTSETDTAQAMSSQHRATINSTAETDVAQPIGARFIRYIAVGQAAETDSASAITERRQQSVNRATETDSANAIASTKYRSIGQATETDAARSISLPGKTNVDVGQAAETDAARPVHSSVRVAQTTETDSAQPITARHRVAVGIATDVEQAQPITSIKRHTVAITTETDEARTIVATKRVPIAVASASESDEAFAMLAKKLAAVGIAVEFDQSQVLDVVGGAPELPARPPLDVVPDLVGFIRAHKGQRDSAMGTLVSFFIHSDGTYPPDAAIDPETGKPFDPTVIPTGDADVEVPVQAGVYMDPVGATRRANGFNNNIGWFENNQAVLDVHPDDYAADGLEDATTVELYGEMYEIIDRDAKGIADRPPHRVLIFARRR